MTPEQRYLFDVTGYLHIKGAVKGEALKAAQSAVDRYIRYRPQYEGRPSLPEVIINRLTPEVQELVQTASYQHTKEIVKQNVVELSN